MTAEVVVKAVAIKAVIISFFFFFILCVIRLMFLFQ